MQADTGELRNMIGMGPDEMRGLSEKGFQELPENLSRAARMKLAGKDRAFVSLTSGGKLSKWAAKQRKAKKKSNQKAKASRRRNRH